MTQNKNSKPKTSVKIEGRPEVSKLSAKEQARTMLNYEGKRIIGEAAKAAAGDVLIDLAQMAASLASTGAAPIVKSVIEVAEIWFEHGTEKAQGIEHAGNMKEILPATIKMYQDYLVANKGRKDLDVRPINKKIAKLQFLLANYEGDIRKIDMLKNTWGPIASGVNKVLSAGRTKLGEKVKFAVLETLDVIPFVCAESAMEVVRFINMKMVLKMFNEHPDVTEEERINVNSAMVVEAFKLQQLRIKASVRHMKVGDIFTFFTSPKANEKK